MFFMKISNNFNFNINQMSNATDEDELLNARDSNKKSKKPKKKKKKSKRKKANEF